ncbi:site-2 protease family protein [Williamsia sterculiae]|uniref:Zn-dependent protease (Includes SpoIVFB) n=1 Tax=Williamsia sterculiae TaxID=1344003 RepID=A0A1N7CQ12_9NOCA|nr:site-2 protease family protein [Williamsia sterculiae]SIR65534.1 Zn-dependent protease (includes SpoIVFB) [Williamsia sterculiae]
MTTTAEIARAVRPGPVFGGVVVATVAGGLLLAHSAPGRNPTSVIGALLLVLGGWVVSLCLHEFSHAVTAFAFGDKNAELRGYLTLNPLRYAHPGLSLVLPLLFILLGGIGFPGGAVYVEQSGFTRAQRSMVSAAGPVSNIVFAVVLLAIVRVYGPESALQSLNLWAALAMLALLQIMAAVLNLIPIPGFDGYGIIEPYLSPQTRRSIAPIAPYGFLLILLILLVPQLNRLFFDVVYWLLELSDVPSWLASYGWGLVVFWR